jgi:hypothetical protein
LVRLNRLIVVAAIGGFSAGCYTLQPAVGVTPELGSKVAFDVNDAGRVALGGSMGPEIAQISGRLVSRDSGDYLLAVSSVRMLRGGEQVWAGEQVRIKSTYISSTYERRFSRGRSIALGAIGLGAVAYFAGRSILGSGTGEPPIIPGDTSITSRGRVPR